MRHLLPALLALLLAGCGPAPIEVDLQLIFGEFQDPLLGAASIEVDARYPDGDDVSGDLLPSSGEHRIEDLRPGTGVVFDVHVTDTEGRVLALGRSQPVDIDTSGASVGVFVGEADSLARIPEGLALARSWSALAPTPSGRVVVAGGGDNEAEPVTEVEFLGWSADDPLHGVAGMDLPRVGHAAFWIDQDVGGPWAGRVAVIGGSTSTGRADLSGAEAGAVASVSTIDPLEGVAEEDVSSLDAAYVGFGAAWTREGRIALVGGIDETSMYVDELRLLDPADGSETSGHPAWAMEQHTVTPFVVQGDEFLLITGGVTNMGELGDLSFWTGLEDDELDDVDGLELNEPRARHQATALGTREVLITGGAADLDNPEDQGRSLASAEIFDPVLRSVTLLNEEMLVARQRHVAVLIPNDRILICAGEDSTGVALGSCETYDIDTGFFEAFTAGSMLPGGPGVSSTSLPDGRIVFVGGASSLGADRSVYLYTPPSFL